MCDGSRAACPPRGATVAWEKAMWARMIGKLLRTASNFRKSQAGATAVEFAIVAAPFFYVLGSTCETGLMLFSEYVLQNSVQNAARLVRTGQVSSADGTKLMTAAEFKTSICGTVSIIFDCDSKVTVYVNSATDFQALTTSIDDPLTIGKRSNGAPYPVVFSPGGQLKAATVIATYDWDFAFPFMEFLGNINNSSARRIYGIAMFRNEPF